jgi:hypothetical protein
MRYTIDSGLQLYSTTSTLLLAFSDADWLVVWMIDDQRGAMPYFMVET